MEATIKREHDVNLEKYFETFRKEIVGIDAEFESPYGRKKLVYADWIASGRLYSLLEAGCACSLAQWWATPIRKSSETGIVMTRPIMSPSNHKAPCGRR